MKRLVVRFSLLTVLFAGVVFFYMETSVTCGPDCAMSVFTKWNSCDNSYSETSQQYALRVSYCELNAPSVCPDQSSATLCGDSCNGNQQCFDTCCLAASRSACQATLTMNYNNRGSSYFSCMGLGGNFGNCIEQVADFCVEAQNRVSICNAMYEGLENSEARSTCVANSGIDHCV